MGEVYKIGFFAKKVLLIEGVSDLILCKAISRKLSLAIDVAGCQIIPVDGKGQFPIVAKLFWALGKEVSILTDLDGFLDDAEIVKIFNTQEKAIAIANDYSARSLSEMAHGVKTALDSLMQRTYQNLAPVYKLHPYYTKESETADSYIERVTHELSGKHRVRVATSDGVEQLIILGSGAMRMSARELKNRIEDANSEIKDIIGH